MFKRYVMIDNVVYDTHEVMYVKRVYGDQDGISVNVKSTFGDRAVVRNIGIAGLSVPATVEDVEDILKEDPAFAEHEPVEEAVAVKDAQLAEKDAEIAEKDAVIEDNEATITSLTEAVLVKDAVIDEQAGVINEHAEAFNAISDILTDDQALEVPIIFPEWEPGVMMRADKRISYNGSLYRVLNDHTSQADWLPDRVPSLYAKILPGQDGGIGDWVQPDSTNPYMIGDRVRHNGHVWICDIDNNVWEPGVTGWHIDEDAEA